MKGPSPLYPNNLTNTFVMDKTWSETNKVQEVQDFAAGERQLRRPQRQRHRSYVLESREPDVRSVLKAFDGHWAEKRSRK